MTASNHYTHREAWLHALADRLQPLFADSGYSYPAFRVTCGFPSTSPLIGSKRQRIGECWHAPSSDDGHCEIMISPTLGSDLVDIAETLAHELCHAVVGPGHGHKGPFVKAAKAIGLEKPWTATKPSEAFKQFVAPILDDLGPYPHAKLNAVKLVKEGPKKQGTRLVKCECPMCGYTVRTTRKWIDDKGYPHCPEHGVMEEGGSV